MEKKYILSLIVSVILLTLSPFTNAKDTPGECGGKIGYGKECVAMKTCPGSGQRCPMRDGIDFDYYQGWNDPQNDIGKATGLSRNQDYVGACARFGYVDMVCQHLVKIGAWPNKKSYCSVLDFHLWYYNKKNKNGNMDQLLNSHAVESFDVTDVLEYAKTVGFCPEESFRSEFANNPWRWRSTDSEAVKKEKLSLYFGATPARLSTFKMKQFREKYKGKTEADASLIGFCEECSKQAALSNDDWKKVQDVLMNSKEKDPELAALTKTGELACKGKRVKLPDNFVISAFSDNHFGDKEYQHIQETMGVIFRFKQPGTVQAAIDPRLIDPTFEIKKDESASHSVNIIGASCDSLPSDKSANPTNLKCFYFIKNSWGLDCQAVPKEKFGDNAKCYGDSGLIMVEQEYLFQGPYKVNSFNYVVDKADNL